MAIRAISGYNRFNQVDMESVNSLLAVRDLKTYFRTGEGLAQAVDGVSFDIHRGQTFALVGESGCGKSVTALSIMQLVPEPAGYIAGGQILYKGTDVTRLAEWEKRRIRRLIRFILMGVLLLQMGCASRTFTFRPEKHLPPDRYHYNISLPHRAEVTFKSDPGVIHHVMIEKWDEEAIYIRGGPTGTQKVPVEDVEKAKITVYYRECGCLPI